MSQAAIFDTPALKWPFAVRPAGAPRPAASTAPVYVPVPVPVPVPIPIPVPVHMPEQPPAQSAGVIDLPDTGIASVAGAGALAAGLTPRQMVTDVLLVAMWGALIPGVLWLGHAVGF